MKRFIILTCYYINIIMVALILFVVIAALFQMKSVLDYIFFNKLFLQIRLILTVPVLVLWINNLMIWSKRDKSISRFLLLFFFNGIYNPFYYRLILKNHWQ
jgi:hypothetical protein